MQHIVTDAVTGEAIAVPFTPEEVLAAENAKKLSAPLLKAFTANKRWLVETGGCPWDGSIVSTDRESQSKLIEAFVMLGSGLRADGEQWKFNDGSFRALTNAQAASMIGAALTHIKTAFAVEAAVLASIDSEAITSTDEVIAAAWPANT